MNDLRPREADYKHLLLIDDNFTMHAYFFSSRTHCLNDNTRPMKVKMTITSLVSHWLCESHKRIVYVRKR